MSALIFACVSISAYFAAQYDLKLLVKILVVRV